MLMASTQEQDRNKKQGMFGGQASNKNTNLKTTSLEEALGLLAQGFLTAVAQSQVRATSRVRR